MMRNVPDSFDPAVVEEIDDRLRNVAHEHRVDIRWAIESGSRAWGFPSPDSDYDCRFVFVRPADQYLSLWPARDVIETPLDEVFDVNGWDLGKALRLLLKGNAVVVEWLRSPIVYTGDDGFHRRMLALADEVSDPLRIARHYLHVGRQQWDGRTDDLPLKKVFYTLRPAAALRWLRTHPHRATPPIDLPTLLEEGEAPLEVVESSAELIRAKSVTRELGLGVFPPALAAFARSEFDLAGVADEELGSSADPAKAARVDEAFRAEIARSS